MNIGSYMQSQIYSHAKRHIIGRLRHLLKIDVKKMTQFIQIADKEG